MNLESLTYFAASGVDATPIVVAIVGAAGGLGAAYIAYRGSQRTKKKVDNLPTDLVKEFAKLNPGVDTVEKVIELLYTEIGRLNTNNAALEAKIKTLVSEKQELLDEISKLKNNLNDHQRKFDYLEARIKNSIDHSGDGVQ